MLLIRVVEGPVTEIGYFLSVDGDPSTTRARAIKVPGHVDGHTVPQLVGELCLISLSQLRPLHQRHLTPELRRTAARNGGVLHASTQAEPRSGLGLNELLGPSVNVAASDVDEYSKATE